MLVWNGCAGVGCAKALLANLQIEWADIWQHYANHDSRTPIIGPIIPLEPIKLRPIDDVDSDEKLSRTLTCPRDLLEGSATINVRAFTSCQSNWCVCCAHSRTKTKFAPTTSVSLIWDFLFGIFYLGFPIWDFLFGMVCGLRASPLCASVGMCKAQK